MLKKFTFIYRIIIYRVIITFYSSSTFANPQILIDSIFWTDETQIYVSNCEPKNNAHPQLHILNPDPGETILDLTLGYKSEKIEKSKEIKNREKIEGVGKLEKREKFEKIENAVEAIVEKIKKEEKSIFALTTSGKLFCIFPKLKKQTILHNFKQPLTQGFLQTKEINSIFTLIVLTTEKTPPAASTLTVFDITKLVHSGHLDHPKIIYQEILDFSPTVKPKIGPELFVKSSDKSADKSTEEPLAVYLAGVSKIEPRKKETPIAEVGIAEAGKKEIVKKEIGIAEVRKTETRKNVLIQKNFNLLLRSSKWQSNSTLQSNSIVPEKIDSISFADSSTKSSTESARWEWASSSPPTQISLINLQQTSQTNLDFILILTQTGALFQISKDILFQKDAPFHKVPLISENIHSLPWVVPKLSHPKDPTSLSKPKLTHHLIGLTTHDHKQGTICLEWDPIHKAYHPIQFQENSFNKIWIRFGEIVGIVGKVGVVGSEEPKPQSELLWDPNQQCGQLITLQTNQWNQSNCEINIKPIELLETRAHRLSFRTLP